MSIEKITQAKAEIEASSAYKVLDKFFDEGSFCEIDAFAKSGDGYAEVVAGFGTVEGQPAYAFAQNSDICGGAMSKAQAAKLVKLYDLALKTGAPVVGFYDSIGGRLSQGNELLKGYGDVLSAASKLSGVVPQISVILGTCLGTGALNAVSADFVIMSKKASLSLDTTGKDSNAEYNASKGISAVTADDTDDAIQKAKELLLYMPSNNLSMAPATFEEEPDPNGGCLGCQLADAQSIMKIRPDYSKTSATAFARIGGQVVGYVVTKGEEIDCCGADKIAKMVRFCDAFSIPVISFVNGKGFSSIKTAAKVTSAYAEATTAKISVITGTAVGALYIAMAGSGANTDLTVALPDAVVSPINPMAAAFIMAPDKMNVPVKEQEKAADEFAKSELSAFKAAENGFVEDVVPAEALRARLIAMLDMLSSKRVPTLAKKHSTI
ncbi:MAG: carboxyl transferase domain-containing protein [Acutalibacteraceae bacterium]